MSNQLDNTRDQLLQLRLGNEAVSIINVLIRRTILSLSLPIYIINFEKVEKPKNNTSSTTNVYVTN